MKYSKENLITALRRLNPNTETLLGTTFLPRICEIIAVDLFLKMDELSDTDIQLSKDICLLRQALRDLKNGEFQFS